MVFYLPYFVTFSQPRDCYIILQTYPSDSELPGLYTHRIKNINFYYTLRRTRQIILKKTPIMVHVLIYIRLIEYIYIYRNNLSTRFCLFAILREIHVTVYIYGWSSTKSTLVHSPNAKDWRRLLMSYSFILIRIYLQVLEAFFQIQHATYRALFMVSFVFHMKQDNDK